MTTSPPPSPSNNNHCGSLIFSKDLSIQLEEIYRLPPTSIGVRRVRASRKAVRDELHRNARSRKKKRNDGIDEDDYYDIDNNDDTSKTATSSVTSSTSPIHKDRKEQKTTKKKPFDHVSSSLSSTNKEEEDSSLLNQNKDQLKATLTPTASNDGNKVAKCSTNQLSKTPSLKNVEDAALLQKTDYNQQMDKHSQSLRDEVEELAGIGNKSSMVVLPTFLSNPMAYQAHRLGLFNNHNNSQLQETENDETIIKNNEKCLQGY